MSINIVIFISGLVLGAIIGYLIFYLSNKGKGQGENIPKKDVILNTGDAIAVDTWAITCGGAITVLDKDKKTLVMKNISNFETEKHSINCTQY